jgi:hypothetical protein
MAVARAALQQIAAVLTFDSWAAPALAAGMRSMRSATRQLLFSASGRDIDLRIDAMGDACSLTGQVLGPDEAGVVRVAFLGHGAGAVAGNAPLAPDREAVLDSLGEFRVDGLAPGHYRLTLLVGDDEITLPQVQVGETAR